MAALVRTESARNRRIFQGRLKGSACMSCRAQHLKCDASQPCTRCFKAGKRCLVIPCATSRHLMPIGTPISVVKGDDLFNKLVLEIAAEGEPPDSFWTTTIASYQQNEMVYHALTSFLMLQMAPTSQSELPHAALRQYCQSLSKPSDNIGVLLQTASLYLGIEGWVDHAENRQNVLRAALCLVQANGSVILEKYRRDDNLYGALIGLLGRVVFTTADKTCISGDLWNSALTLALRLAAERDASEYTLLKIEACNIAFDFGRDDFATLAVGYRLKNWRRRFEEYRKSVRANGQVRAAPDLDALERLIAQPWHYWKWTNYQEKHDEDFFRSKAMEDLARLESMPCVNITTSSFTIRDIEDGIICRAVEIAWYLRDEDVAVRLGKILLHYRPEFPWVDNVLEYIDVIRKTRHGQPTTLDTILFGQEQATIRECRHHMRTMSYLARNWSTQTKT